MTVTLPVILILGVVVAGLLKFRALGIGAGIAAALFGFYLADTGAASSINQIMKALASIGN